MAGDHRVDRLVGARVLLQVLGRHRLRPRQRGRPVDRDVEDPAQGRARRHAGGVAGHLAGGAGVFVHHGASVRPGAGPAGRGAHP
ncbi:hypothetical protein SDC9_106928 [bioreactor metagenome]|uniref:Uncharacterized protein n=1 Tax=bioreactor metagenome TaxID=1076179 RepID=A0A645B642_9ZZZZ